MHKSHTTEQAEFGRDALAKAVYDRLFSWIVGRINVGIAVPGRRTTGGNGSAARRYNSVLGVLDIYGFEIFERNSFEQFCINYCNEKLQKFFNDNILRHEQELYRREGLNVPEIKFTDNQDVIELIESKANGIFTLLDEESKLPKPSFAHFTAEVHAAWANHYRLTWPRSSRLKAHRELRDDEGFLVRHFAGAVCYNTNQFIEKNNDALHASLECLVQESGSELLRRLFASAAQSAARGKLNFISVGSKFKTQLGELMEKLERNGTNFVRCIKPNSRMTAAAFEGSLALAQLNCSGTTAVLELMEYGFPSRVPFAELYNMYRAVLPPELARLAPKTFCEAMLYSLRLSSSEFKFGITKVFFRPGKFIEFDRIMRSDPENLRAIVANVKKWLVRSRWVKSGMAAVCVIKLRNRIAQRGRSVVQLQRWVRGFLARQQHRPRVRGLGDIVGVRATLAKTREIAGQLRQQGGAVVEHVQRVERQAAEAAARIKADARIRPAQIEALVAALRAELGAVNGALERQLLEERQAEEQARVRKIQEALEAERQLKEAEERRVRAEEETRRRKQEMEARRRAEEAERRRVEELDRSAAQQLQEQLEREAQEDAKYRQQLEQERRDHELALRLAQESNGQVDDSPPLARK